MKVSSLKSKNGNCKLRVGGSTSLSTKRLQISNAKQEKEVRVALLGASGYTGAEVCGFCCFCGHCYSIIERGVKLLFFGGRLLDFLQTIHTLVLL